MKSLTRRVVSVAAAAMIMSATAMVGAAPASAADTGGDGNPSSCTGAYTVQSQPIYGTRGATNGQVIAYLELRWSNSCYGNWARVLTVGGLYTSPVNAALEVDAEGRYALANDTYTVPSGGTSSWTPFLRLQNSSSTACVSAHLSSDFGTSNYHTNGTSFCSH